MLCVLAPIPGIGMMMTHCMNSTGKATFKPLGSHFWPPCKGLQSPLSQDCQVLEIFNIFALISSEGVAIRNNDRTNVNGKFSAIITECTNLCELIYNSSLKVELWTIFLRDVGDVFVKTGMIPKTTKAGGYKGGTDNCVTHDRRAHLKVIHRNILGYVQYF